MSGKVDKELAFAFQEVHAELKLDSLTANASHRLFNEIARLEIRHASSLYDQRNHLRRCIATAIFIVSVDAEKNAGFSSPVIFRENAPTVLSK